MAKKHIGDDADESTDERCSDCERPEYYIGWLGLPRLDRVFACTFALIFRTARKTKWTQPSQALGSIILLAVVVWMMFVTMGAIWLFNRITSGET